MTIKRVIRVVSSWFNHDDHADMVKAIRQAMARPTYRPCQTR